MYNNERIVSAQNGRVEKKLKSYGKIAQKCLGKNNELTLIPY